MPQRHHLASGSFWDSERLFGEDGDPANLEHQAASGAILPYMASAVPNVDVGLWDLALGQSKITGIFFRQGHRARNIIL